MPTLPDYKVYQDKNIFTAEVAEVRNNMLFSASVKPARKLTKLELS